MPKTSLLRSIDFRYPSNKFIIYFSILSGILLLFFEIIFHSNGFESSLEYSIRGGILVFLTWALSREIDPDYELTANLSAVLIFSLLFLGFVLPSGLLTLALLMFILRITNRSIGRSVGIIDILILNFLTIFISLVTVFPAGLIFLLSLAINASLNPENKFFYLISSLPVIFVTLFQILTYEQSLYKLQIVDILIMILFFVISFLKTLKLKSLDDSGLHNISKRRLLLANIVFLFSLFLGIVTKNNEFIESLKIIIYTYFAIYFVSIVKLYTNK